MQGMTQELPLLGGTDKKVESRYADGFSGSQTCSLVGISYRQLDYWARTNLLRPSVSDAVGSGSKRRYSYRDVLELKVIKQLLDAGVSLQSSRKAIESLRGEMGENLASANLVMTGSRSLLVHSRNEVVDLLQGGQGVFNIVALSGIVDELNAEIVQIQSSSLDQNDFLSQATVGGA